MDEPKQETVKAVRDFIERRFREKWMSQATWENTINELLAKIGKSYEDMALEIEKSKLPEDVFFLMAEAFVDTLDHLRERNAEKEVEELINKRVKSIKTMQKILFENDVLHKEAVLTEFEEPSLTFSCIDRETKRIHEIIVPAQGKYKGRIKILDILNRNKEDYLYYRVYENREGDLHKKENYLFVHDSIFNKPL